MPDLVADCEALLVARRTLDANGILNWSAETDISIWDGVTLNPTSTRVSELVLVEMDLGGEIPPELSRLSSLVHLRLCGNQLTGTIPPELNRLSGLKRLRPLSQPTAWRYTARTRRACSTRGPERRSQPAVRANSSGDRRPDEADWIGSLWKPVNRRTTSRTRQAQVHEVARHRTQSPHRPDTS